MKNSPTIGFSLILQLTGVNGSRQFDKLTKTKTVETILTSMDEEGIKDYIDHLLKQVDEEPSASGKYVLRTLLPHLPLSHVSFWAPLITRYRPIFAPIATAWTRTTSRLSTPGVRGSSSS